MQFYENSELVKEVYEALLKKEQSSLSIDPLIANFSQEDALSSDCHSFIYQIGRNFYPQLEPFDFGNIDIISYFEEKLPNAKKLSVLIKGLSRSICDYSWHIYGGKNPNIFSPDEITNEVISCLNQNITFSRYLPFTSLDLEERNIVHSTFILGKNNNEDDLWIVHKRGAEGKVGICTLTYALNVYKKHMDGLRGLAHLLPFPMEKYFSLDRE